jgi:hypothetical protein
MVLGLDVAILFPLSAQGGLVERNDLKKAALFMRGREG